MDKNLQEECPICFYINAHNECVLFECCDKYIHKDCIEDWLRQNKNTSESKCIYCYKSNKFIDDFINKNNNHQNINEQIVNIPQNINHIIESQNNTFQQNNNNNQNKCSIFLLVTILLTFSGWAILWSALY